MICCSEHTYLAHGPSEEAVVRFEASADYQALLEAQRPRLRAVQ